MDQHSTRASAEHPATPVLYEAAFSTTGTHPQCGVALTRTITEARHKLADMLLLCDPAVSVVADIVEFTRARVHARYTGTISEVFAQLTTNAPAAQQYIGTAGDVAAELEQASR